MFATSFEAEEQSFRNRKTAIAAFVTLALHALILLFLIWMILTPPNPPYTEAGGVSVNFGTDESGSGDIQPMTLTPIQADFTPVASSATSQKASSEEDIATQELEDAPVIENQKNKTPNQKPDDNALFKPNKNTNNNKSESSNLKSETPAPPAPKADPNALFKKGAQGTPNNSKGDGTGGGQGDQGNPNGDPNSRNYLGDGEGTGSGGGKGDLSGGFSLKGRSKISLPAPAKCNSQGKVVVAIKVDRTGKVVDAKVKQFESTAVDECNISNALTAARKASFTPDATAPEIQEGTITYIYKVN